MSKSNKINLIK